LELDRRSLLEGRGRWRRQGTARDLEEGERAEEGRGQEGGGATGLLGIWRRGRDQRKEGGAGRMDMRQRKRMGSGDGWKRLRK
jgi:hypothetical protein